MGKLEKGKWYKYPSLGKGKFKFLFDGDFSNLQKGFSSLGNWVDEGLRIRKDEVDDYFECSEEEIEKVLIKEAKNRGLWGDVKIEAHATGNTSNLNKRVFKEMYSEKEDKLYNTQGVIYYQGNWATPLKEKTNNMNSQTLTRKQLVILYNQFDCTDWRTTIKQYLNGLVIADDATCIQISDEDIKYAHKNATKAQKEALKDVGIKFDDDKNAFVRKFTVDKLDSISKELFENSSALQIGTRACNNMGRKDLKGKSLYVDCAYEVITHKTRMDGTVIEIRKK